MWLVNIYTSVTKMNLVAKNISKIPTGRATLKTKAMSRIPTFSPN